MNKIKGFQNIERRAPAFRPSKMLLGLLVLSSLMLGGCTTCDVALWMGNDVCEIGGF